MSLLIYNIFLLILRIGMPIAAFFKPKAKKWVEGRKNIFEKLKREVPAQEKIIWAHCASLGEFEQGRPVFEQLKKNYPSHKILLTFFSPSGYDAMRDYKGVDWVFYLPLDGAVNAKKFLEIVHPSLVIFVKYEFWYYYLKKIKYRNIPFILISAIFRENDISLKWYKKIQLKMLSRFDHLFVQNEESKQVLYELNISNASVSGDTRFDRVVEIAAQWQPISDVEEFLNNSRTIVAGSTWPEDETALQNAYSQMQTTALKLIIAPHEINEEHINNMLVLFPNSIKLSEWKKLKLKNSNFQTLIIDNIGMLANLYNYGYINYVGGGLRKMGVHNVLEAAVYSKPVIYGKYFQKYAEAINLIEAGGAKYIDEESELPNKIMDLLLNDHYYHKTGHAASEFVKQHTGATKVIINYIQENRLLTN